MRLNISLLLLLIGPLIYAQQLEEPVIVPFQLSPNGHIMISAKINGVEGNFIFDTGAGLHLLTKKFADKVKNLNKTQHFYTGHRATGEALEIDLWKAESLTIETLNLKNQIVAVYDIDFPLDGLISLTSFKERAVTIDYKEKHLVLETQNSLDKREKKSAFQMPLQITNVRDIEIGISTAVVVNDSLVLDVGLDSGAGNDVYRFNARYMPILGVDSTTIDNQFRPSYFNPEEGNMYYTTTLSNLSNSGKNVDKKQFKATFIQGLLYEGIMSINWIGEVLTIDIANKRLLVQ
ncbi:retropepsin-like aspartic protease [Flavimarina sp. Hel_I_48]|uniref:retropepsin-like aspartic protease n=1 Tax=Flavimarina sp. Hel_I_48 TaxID=1392488 RepID=UPI0004DF0AAE|nr:retropepsin-like aspartic protease [Flavimarina sp. Hel_I_48]